MSEYTLYFAQTASSSVTVEADSLDDAIEKAYENTPRGVCAQCAGWGSDRPGIDLSGDWEIDEKAAREDYPESGDES